MRRAAVWSAFLVLTTAAVPVFGQSPTSAAASERGKVLFAVAESFAEVGLNAYFGEQEANRAAFQRLKASVAKLNEPKLMEKVVDAEKDCTTKGCKSTIPPLNHVLKEWTNVQKRSGADAGYAGMGTAAGTVAFHFRYLPKLHPTLRVHMTSASMTATNFASGACTETPGCSTAVHDAFERLNSGIGDESMTAEQATALLQQVRAVLGVQAEPEVAAK